MTIRCGSSAHCTAPVLTISQGKRVAVVGNGSSGIQIVPALLPDVPHIDHYMRSRTWVSPSFAREHIDKRGDGIDNFSFTAEEIETFKKDHQSYQKFRKGRFYPETT